MEVVPLCNGMNHAHPLSSGKERSVASRKKNCGSLYERTVQGFKEGRVSSGWIVVVEFCALVVGPVGNVLECRIVVTVLQIFGVQNTRSAARIDDIIESNLACGAVAFTLVGR